MKRTVSILLFLSLVLMSTACSSAAIDDRLIGTWYQSTLTGTCEWHFSADGHLTRSDSDLQSSTLEYTAENGTLTIGPNSFKTVYTYRYGSGEDGHEYLFLYDGYDVLKVTLLR